MAKKKKTKRYLTAVVVLGAIAALLVGLELYKRYKAPNTSFKSEREFLLIPTGTTFEGLLVLVEQQGFVKNTESFRKAALQLELDDHLKPGRYKIEKDMNNLDMVRLLRSGRQTPVNVVINKFRSRGDFAAAISRKLELDSTVLLIALNDDVYMSRFGLNSQTAMALFIPNTYEFYWNTDVDKFFKRMSEEYTKFWNDDRMRKAAKLDLEPYEVTTLASIVEEETNAEVEKPVIASVYLNRLKKGMMLQADPTVKFAIGDFSIRRITKKHTAVQSPYNTYARVGLPPGPICTPSVKSIDAVLNPDSSDYLFFCADPERPGLHVFASTWQEHQKNAARYHHYLNQLSIF